MTEAGTDNTETNWRLKKELEPVFADLNTIDVLTVTFDRQGRIISFNKACEQTTGYSFHEVRGRHIEKLFLIPEEIEPFKATCEKLKAGSSLEYKYESYWVTKDGTRRRIAWTSSVFIDEEDTVEYIISTGIDITDRELWAKQLNQQNQRIQLLAKISLKIRQSLQLEEILQTTVTEVRNLLGCDRVLIYRLWSDGTGSGFTEAVVPGKTVLFGHTFESEVFPEEYKKLYACGRIRAIEDVEKAEISPCMVEFMREFGVKAKLVVPIILKEELWGLLIAHQCDQPREWSSFEIELLKQLGDQVSIALAQAQYQEHLEELVAQRTAELTNTNKRLQQEIADRKRTEKALRESEERWRSLVQNAPDVIFTCDRDGKLLFINRTVPGITVKQAIGTSVYDYVPLEYQDILRQSFEHVFQTGEPSYYETSGTGANGTTSWYTSRVGAIQHEGQVVAVMVIATDITKRKRAEEAVQQWAFREQALNQVVQAIRHSLDLETIFSTAVEEVGKHLQVDRVVIVQYLPEQKLWLNVADYRTSPDLPVALGLKIPDEGNLIAARLKRSEVVRIDDASTYSGSHLDEVQGSGFSGIGNWELGIGKKVRCTSLIRESLYQDKINGDFAQTFRGAWLLVPLHFGSTVWGTLSLVVENRPYPWQESEVELTLAVAEQLAIAIQQAQLLHQSCTATVKAQEQANQLAQEIVERQRTEEGLRQSEAKFRELAQKEALLNQLASQIRRSLDLNTILETAVHEIRNLLQIDRCFFLWYRPDAATPVWEVVTEAKTSIFPSLIGHGIPVTTFAPLTVRIFNKEITRVESAKTLTDPLERKLFFSIGYTALLALPIHTTSGEIGVVSCGHSSGSRPWRDSEVELLQAVADQIAIAIDQAQLLHQSRTATLMAQEQAAKLEKALGELRDTQAQLVQSEKMSSLGQLVAGVAHEINNPVSFIYGNLSYVNQYAQDLLTLVQRYQEHYPQSAEIQSLAEEIDLEFIREDLPKILTSMRIGTERISQIVLSLRNFSRIDEAEMKWVDIHSGLDNTLLILSHRLKAKQSECPDIQVIKDYGSLPNVQCYPRQLNQVFMNILSNAIEAIDEYNKERALEDIRNYPSTIWICTQVLADCNQVVVLIGDNGPGMTQNVAQRLFEPFFTTKPVGSGTGLGLSISYQVVVEKHRGQMQCISAPGCGTAFLIYLPIRQ